MIKGQRAVLTDKKSGSQEFGIYYGKSDDHYIIDPETGYAKLYPTEFWECEEAEDERH